MALLKTLLVVIAGWPSSVMAQSSAPFVDPPGLDPCPENTMEVHDKDTCIKAAAFLWPKQACNACPRLADGAIDWKNCYRDGEPGSAKVWNLTYPPGCFYLGTEGDFCSLYMNNIKGNETAKPDSGESWSRLCQAKKEATSSSEGAFTLQPIKAEIVASSSICPGSASFLHASCEVSVTFPNTQCADVQVEVEARMAAQNGWKDPHNGGSYGNRSPATASLIQGKHITGSSQHYEDHFNLAFEQNGADCKLSGCSESQVTSYLDFSTNFCNMHDLYCGSEDKCPVVKSDFKGYTETFGSCKQHDSTKCIKAPSDSEESNILV